MKRFVKVVHKHVRASLMYCIIAKTHRSKMFFQIQNDDWLIPNSVKTNMVFQAEFGLWNMDRLRITRMEVVRDGQGNTFGMVHHHFLYVT